LFSQTEDSATITNTTDKTSIIGNGTGSLSVPPKGFRPADGLHLKMGGIMSCLQNETIDFTIESNGVVLVDSDPLQLSGTTNKGWELELDFTIRQLGDAGTAEIKSNGQFVHNKDANNVYEGITFNSINNTTFSTNVLNALQIIIQWGSASASNSIYSSSCKLFRTYQSVNINV
jgi:hypothetical protein